jgi:hypothetical protein
MDYFPRARFVICVRDPRDQVVSELNVIERRDALNAAGGSSLIGLAQRFGRAVDATLAAFAVAPHRFHFVRYEDLVSEPTRVIPELAAFCGLDLSGFDPSGDWRRMAVSRDQLALRPSFSQLYGRPISVSRVGRYRERLSPDEVSKVEQETRTAMARFNYAVAKRPTDESRQSLDIEYVIVAEKGYLERQAILLVESIRQLAGEAGRAAITVASPRASRRPSRACQRAVERLGAEYIPLTVNSPCEYYRTSLKLGTMQLLEKRPGPAKLVMLDTDTLFLAAPDFSLPERAVALRPVDHKGISTSGSGDRFDEYWRRLCTLCGVSYEDIPWIESAVDGQRIKANHNGGLIAANRNDGLFATTYEFLGRAVSAGVLPNPDATEPGSTKRTGAGQVTVEERRIWGSAQSALSLAIVAQKLSARILPPTYNVPCLHFNRLIQRYPQVIEGSVHAHYHWLCDAAHMNGNPLMDGRMVISDRVRNLLQTLVPVDRPLPLMRRLRDFIAEPLARPQTAAS